MIKEIWESQNARVLNIFERLLKVRAENGECPEQSKCRTAFGPYIVMQGNGICFPFGFILSKYGFNKATSMICDEKFVGSPTSHHFSDCSMIKFKWVT